MLQMYVSIVSDISEAMLQSFHMDITKVDQRILHMLQVFERDVVSICSNRFICFQTYFASVLIWMLHMSSHICCNNMFQMFHLFQSSVAASVFMLQVASVLSGCCISFHTYVTSVCSKCFICFRRMLQVFYLDVAYVGVSIYICCKRML
jgi:hypothetical protein